MTLAPDDRVPPPLPVERRVAGVWEFVSQSREYSTLLLDEEGRVLWANLHLLFWLSLFPFTTAWMGENHFAPAPTALYGVVLFMAAIAYTILQQQIIAAEGPASPLARAIGHDWKGKLSPVLYLSGIGLAFVSPWISEACYVTVAIIWIVPDRRLARAAHGGE